MSKIKKYIWILPLIAAIISFVSLFVPIAYNTNPISDNILWITGAQFNKTGIGIATNEFLSLFSFISTALILICIYSVIKTFYNFNWGKKPDKRMNIEKYWLLWVIIGIILILTIYLYISFDYWDRFDLTWDYWIDYNFNGAIILMYISGGLLILSGILLKLLKHYDYI